MTTTPTAQKETVTIDGAGKVLGRVATEAANALRGKDRVDFVKNRIPNVVVQIENAGKIHLGERKRAQKEYRHYTGYPGGLRKERAEKLIERRGMSELVRRAVYGMLPTNRLRAESMKRLEVRE